MADGKDEDEKLTVVTDQEGADGGETVVLDEEAAKTAAAEDERVGNVEADADEHEAEDQGASEEVRAQRRIERKAKKERQRAAQDRNRKELDFLRKRNEDLERRFSATERRVIHTEAATVDDRISQVDRHLDTADQVMASAIENKEGKEYVEAQRAREQLLEHKRKLVAYKERLVNEDRQRQEAPVRQEAQQPPQVDPQLIRHADQWMKRNNWFDPNKGDDDSAIVTALDERLATEGFDPTTSEYWEELTDRAKKMLPHRFQAARPNGNGNAHAERRGPVMANGARERTLKSGEVYVTADRVQALKDLGVWDDVKIRNRYLRQYEKYDREVAEQSN